MTASQWPKGIPFVDPGVEHVGVSRLRALNATSLGELSTMLVVQENDRPLAVILSYRQYLAMQRKLQEALDALELLGSEDNRNRLRKGLADAAEGRVSRMKSIRKGAKK